MQYNALFSRFYYWSSNQDRNQLPKILFEDLKQLFSAICFNQNNYDALQIFKKY